MFNSILRIFFEIAFTYFALTVVYLLILSLIGKLFYKDRHNVQSVAQKKIAVLVPAYREDGIILYTADNLLHLDYPSQLYDVYIIADSFAKETLEKLRQLPLHVIEVSFENSTKTKALNAAFARIEKQYDVALICDADNVLARDFLQKINNAFMNGAKAVQGRRVAKNLDTSFAILDACSEGINNNIFRKGANASGLSSSIIGSGMAYDFTLVKQLLSEISAVGGFDKILQLKVVQQGIKIYYLEDALVFDEKVDSAHAFKQQRKRWVSSQFIYLKQFFFPAFKQLFKGNLSYFNLAVINNFILPRAFLFLILPLLAIVSWFISTSWGIAATGLLIMYFLALVIAIPSELVNKNLLQAVLRIPRAILLMAGTLFQGKKANKTFIHTVHTKTEVTNPYLDRLPKR
jgi:cellulose synthase/poly-beta-1,6-N-acetylglucosamine synthase-like glycosyltransferase